MYKTLASWRGLLVVVIVLYHTPIAAFTEAAHMGVSLFIVMSGALLAMRHPRVECTWRQWMWPRARRIYLVHWLALAMLALLQWPMGDFKIDWTLPANALLVHPYVPVRDAFLSYNKPTWFLSALLLCYACYPLLSAALSRLRLRGKWMVAAAMAVVHCVVMAVVPQHIRDWLADMPLTRLGEFVWGMVLGASLPAIEAGCGTWVRRHATLVEIAVLTAVTGTLIAVRHMPWLDCCEDMLVWWIPSSMIIAMCVILNANEGLVGRLMATRPMTWLGSVSLEVFMLSAAVTYFYSHYLAGLAGHWGHTEFYDISWPITLPLTLLAAYVFHYLTNKISK